MFRNLFFASLLLATLPPGPLAWSESSGSTGNEALPEGIYANWPGAERIVNCHSRVYWSWLNESNSSYFRGDTAALNEAIACFVDILMRAEVSLSQSTVQSSLTDVPRHEVILRPGPATIKTQDSAEIAFDWKLDIERCVSTTPARKYSTSRVLEDFPVLTVYVGDGNINLQDVQIPQDVSLVRLADLRDRYLAGLKSVDPTERGIAADRLAGLDFFSSESIPPIAELLRDPDTWVQSSARFALRFMGKTGRPILAKELERPDLKEADLKILREGIQFIDDTAVDTEAAAKFHARISEIDAFVTRHNEAAHAAKTRE